MFGLPFSLTILITKGGEEEKKNICRCMSVEWFLIWSSFQPMRKKRQMDEICDVMWYICFEYHVIAIFIC